MESILGKGVVSRFDKGYGSRGTFASQWQSCARYALPNDASFQEEQTPGQDRMRYILDATAPRALEMFASFLHTMLNNPATKWIGMGIEGEDPTSIDITEKAWLEKVEQILLGLLAAEDADIYAQLHQLYIALGAFGTAVLYIDADETGKRIRTRQYHLDDCVPAEGAGEMIDSMVRRKKYSRRNALAKFGAEKLKGCPKFDGRPIAPNDDSDWMDQEVEFYHFAFPTTDSAFLNTSVRFKILHSIAQWEYFGGWVVKDDKFVVEEVGFHEFPYIVPRWYKARGETYGRSPTMTNMPDIRMVNQMSATILRGAEKIVDPPLVVRDGGLVSPVRLSPGGITYVEGDTEIKTLIPPGTSRIETGNELLKQRQQNIREGYFTPLFITPDSPVKTATQVMQEVDERNRAVSPMLVRIQSELFHPLIRRVFGLAQRGDLLPDPPQRLMADIANGRRKLKLEYTSPLIASQRQLDGLSLVRLFQTMAPWAGVDPGIFDNIDIDQTAKVLHAASGAPASVFRSNTKRETVRTARMENAKAAQAQQTALQGGEVTAKIAAATRPTG